MKTFVTFGQSHTHRVNQNTFDRDCVAVIEAPTAARGRELAFEFFGPQFCFSYFEEQWVEEDQLHYFPRGYIRVNGIKDEDGASCFGPGGTPQ